MASRVDTLAQGGSLPSKRVPPSSYRRGHLTSTKRFPMPEMEESQFIVKMAKDARQKLAVTDDKDEEENKENLEEKEGAWVTMVVQRDRLVVVQEDRGWGWKLGCIRRYGYSTTSFYFESGRKARTGIGVYTFLTDCGERIHSRLNMVKEFCQFDLFCQRGIIPDLLIAEDQPIRARSLRDKSERTEGQSKAVAGEVRRVSTSSLP